MTKAVYSILALSVTFGVVVNAAGAESFPYDLDQPDAAYSLPRVLQEVSAASCLDNDELALIQDERGRIYFFSLGRGEVTETTTFKATGDFEGLEIIDNRAYALRSDGTLYTIENYRSDRSGVTATKTFLNARDDTEGLAYDPLSNQMLIIGKLPPKLDGKRKAHKRAGEGAPAGSSKMGEVGSALTEYTWKPVAVPNTTLCPCHASEVTAS